jgi:hypothetical protein
VTSISPVSGISDAYGVHRARPRPDDIAAPRSDPGAFRPGRPGEDPDAGPRSEAAERIAARTGAPRDTQKVEQLGTVLDATTEELAGLSPAEVVRRLQTKGVELDQLRSVLQSGALLDVKA